jgi:hypothetical protein
VETGRIDLLQTLFDYGLKLDERHMNKLMNLVVESRDKTMLEMALEQGWDINAPPVFGPPVLG